MNIDDFPDLAANALACGTLEDNVIDDSVHDLEGGHSHNSLDTELKEDVHINGSTNQSPYEFVPIKRTSHLENQFKNYPQQNNINIQYGNDEIETDLSYDDNDPSIIDDNLQPTMKVDTNPFPNQSPQNMTQNSGRHNDVDPINSFHKYSTPISLRSHRQSSVTLFARPKVVETEDSTQDNSNLVEYDENLTIDNDIRAQIHHRRAFEGGSALMSAIEVDYENDSTENSVFFTQSDVPQCSGFIDGNFSNGRILDIETPSKCYVVKFNLDYSLLAIGQNGGKGLLIYETTSFSLIHTIPRSDTVSAIDWVYDPFSEKFTKENDYEKLFDQSRRQLLAVGGYDGVVTIYSIDLISLNNGVNNILYEVEVMSEVYSLSFLSHDLVQNTHIPLTLAIGEGNGKVSFLVANKEIHSFDDISGIRRIIDLGSSVLSISFGIVNSKVVLACGTRDGLIRAYSLYLRKKEWCLSSTLFNLHRNGSVRALKFNHDSSILVAGGYDKRVLIVRTALWKIVRELQEDGTINTIEFDPLNRYLLLGTRANLVTFFDTSTYQRIKTLKTQGWVTNISWGGDSLVAVRSDDKAVSLIRVEPIESLNLSLDSSRGEACSVSWTHNGRYLARTHDNEMVINDSWKGFAEIVRVTRTEVIREARFCQSKHNRDRLAVVGHDGFLSIYQLRMSVGKFHLEKISSVFLEKNLWTVAWSTNGKWLAAGGKGMKMHVICAESFRPLRPPVGVGGKVKGVDFLSEEAYNELGPFASSFAMAVTTGQNMAKIFDVETFLPTIEISRKRTVRCLKYHPSLPVLAIGDGGNDVIIVDLVAERKISSFSVCGRVNAIDFSPAGDFIAVGSDNCSFTIHDTDTFKVVQEIPAKAFATAVAFSGIDGRHIAIAHADGEMDVIKLGLFLSIDYISLDKRYLASKHLPTWALREAVYRSPEGPSFLQRCLSSGSKESLLCASSILEDSPDAILTFNRQTGCGCFETAVELRKPNIVKLILTTLVKGNHTGEEMWSARLLTTSVPYDAIISLLDLVLYHPPEYATDILKQMRFIKVPFTMPKHASTRDMKEIGSISYLDPWGARQIPISVNKMSNEVHDEIDLVPAVLPLPGLGTLEFLAALTSNMGPEVFDNDAMGIVLRVMWDSGVKHYFLFDFALNVMVIGFWVLVVDKTATTHTSIDHSDRNWPLTCIVWTTIILNSFLVAGLILRYYGNHHKYFVSTWHYIDVLCVGLVYGYVFAVIGRDTNDESLFYLSNSAHGYVPLGVVTTLCLTAKFVSLLRGFDRTGWLVAVLTQNFLDVRGFVIILLTILLGFTVAFRLLFANVQGECKVELVPSANDSLDKTIPQFSGQQELRSVCDANSFDSLSRSLLSTFELTILGSYDEQILFESQEVFLAAFTFIMAVTIILVVALNALIAILGDSFSRVQENVTANRRRERAELIVEYLSILPLKRRKQLEYNTTYFHALLESDGHGDLQSSKDDWQGGLNALKRELVEINETHFKRTQHRINQMRTELTEEIGIMMENEISSVLNDIFLELKGISSLQQRIGVANGLHRIDDLASVQSIGHHLAPFDGIRRNFNSPRNHSLGGPERNITI